MTSKTRADYLKEYIFLKADADFSLQLGGTEGFLKAWLDCYSENYRQELLVELVEKIAEYNNVDIDTIEDYNYDIEDEWIMNYLTANEIDAWEEWIRNALDRVRDWVEEETNGKITEDDDVIDYVVDYCADAFSDLSWSLYLAQSNEEKGQE